MLQALENSFYEGKLDEENAKLQSINRYFNNVLQREDVREIESLEHCDLL